jgi:hypothetical protein
MRMKIMTAVVRRSESGPIYQIDVIEFDNKLWLVPLWCDVPAAGVSKPVRIIRMDTLPHQKTEPGNPHGHYFLDVPLPEPLLGIKTPNRPIEGFEFEEMPEITVSLASRQS